MKPSSSLPRRCSPVHIRAPSGVLTRLSQASVDRPSAHPATALNRFSSSRRPSECGLSRGAAASTSRAIVCGRVGARERRARRRPSRRGGRRPARSRRPPRAGARASARRRGRRPRRRRRSIQRALAVWWSADACGYGNSTAGRPYWASSNTEPPAARDGEVGGRERRAERDDVVAQVVVRAGRGEVGEVAPPGDVQDAVRRVGERARPPPR